MEERSLGGALPGRPKQVDEGAGSSGGGGDWVDTAIRSETVHFVGGAYVGWQLGGPLEAEVKSVDGEGGRCMGRGEKGSKEGGGRFTCEGAVGSEKVVTFLGRDLGRLILHSDGEVGLKAAAEVVEHRGVVVGGAGVPCRPGRKAQHGVG